MVYYFIDTKKPHSISGITFTIDKNNIAKNILIQEKISRRGKHLLCCPPMIIYRTNGSHIDPSPMVDPRNPNMGGVARRAALIETIRQENPNVLLLDAGDIFQGTHYFNYYGGELEFKLMSIIKYDASTIGNHDFDSGVGWVYAQMPHTTFEFISSNHDFKNTVMDGFVKPYKIFDKGCLYGQLFFQPLNTIRNFIEPSGFLMKI